jgi:transposase
MAGSLFWLSDEASERIEPHLPKNQPGARRVDDRRVISGIIHMLKCGGRWVDCPSEYGPATTIYNRWNRWSRRGLWRRMFAALSAQGPLDELAMLDATYVKAHRSAHGGKGGEGAGHWGLARRADHQNSRRLRPPRPSRRADAHARQHLRHQGGGASEGADHPLSPPCRRSRLRRQQLPQGAQGSQNDARHPRPHHPQAAHLPRRKALQGPLADRGHVLPIEGLPPRRHPLRQACRQLPLGNNARSRRCLLAMIESEP